MKVFEVFIAGGTKVTTIHASCIEDATDIFRESLNYETDYRILNKVHATIKIEGYHGFMNDYVVIAQ